MSLSDAQTRGSLVVRYDSRRCPTPPDVLFGCPQALFGSGRFERVHVSRGAEVFRGQLQPDGPTVYWKEFRQRRTADRLKDLLRASRARRAVEGGERMVEIGVGVPEPIALGEVRTGPRLDRCFLVTLAVAGHRSLVGNTDATGLVRLAAALARLHVAGYVHGDLKPSNVMLEENGAGLVILDNERTRRSRSHREQVRNLVQLFVDPELDLVEGGREAFLERYFDERGFSARKRASFIFEVEAWIAERRLRIAARSASA